VVTPQKIRARLRELLAGERTEEAVAEAERLLVELGGGEKRPPAGRARPVVEDGEAAKWRRLVSGSPMSRRIWAPGPPSGHVKALQRDSFSPWR
jgi:hypothetical protein